MAKVLKSTSFGSSFGPKEFPADVFLRETLPGSEQLPGRFGAVTNPIA